MLRRVLDAAAAVINDAIQSKYDSLICSELVYRAFDEAVRDSDVDPYTIHIGTHPTVMGLLGRNGRLRGRGFGSDSLIAVVTSPGFSASSRPAAHGARLHQASFLTQTGTDELLAEADKAIAEYIANYNLVDLKTEPVTVAQSIAPSIEAFALQWASVDTLLGGSSAPSSRIPKGFLPQSIAPLDAAVAVGDALAHLRHTCADFVTPHDLEGTESLYDLQ